MENLNDIVWGVPTQKTRKTEKYDFPVVTMVAIEKNGSNRKFIFNKAAMEKLELVGGESTLAVGFKNTQILLRKEGPLALAKNNSFSDKRIFEHIAKIAGLDTTVENEFSLVEENGNIYSLASLSSSTGENVSEVEYKTLEPKMNIEVEESVEEVVEEVMQQESPSSTVDASADILEKAAESNPFLKGAFVKAPAEPTEIPESFKAEVEEEDEWS